MLRTPLRLYQASRIFSPVLMNRNLPALGCPVLFTPNTLSMNCKSTIAVPKEEEKPSILMRVLTKFYDVSQSKYNSVGVLLYDKCANEQNFVEMIEVLKLPDSFISWFLITELHIWMVMTKCTVLEDKGRHLRNAMVKMFWDDALVRMKKIQPSGTNKVIQDLNQQFRAALFSYDEGIQSSDIVLANSMWRRFYSNGHDFRAEEIEIMVSYVRRQMTEIHKISDEDFCKKPKFQWVPLKVKV